MTRALPGEKETSGVTKEILGDPGMCCSCHHARVFTRVKPPHSRRWHCPVRDKAVTMHYSCGSYEMYAGCRPLLAERGA